NKDVKVVRNIPSVCKPPINESKESLNLPIHQTILILQGNAIHRDRGGEEIIEAMPLIENAFLLVIGSGDVIPDLKQRTAALQISDRVRFIDRIPPEKLFNYTYFADIGIAFDKDVSLNHFFSLPNKIFDYIRAETPYLSSNLPERKFITEKYETGVVLPQLTPQTIADTVNKLMKDKDFYQILKENCKQAATELTWENEEKTLKEIYKNLFVFD
ncbi:MAG: glycosyltransferase family 4 protein, partial [Bacteroidales bacterium]|nr:glycosyltransferase family 4 protein [Bacteroidales bacterium]